MSVLRRPAFAMVGLMTEYLRKMITATGRSYANLIYKEKGEVDQNASRRVVFKFRLKDTKSLDELKKMIQETSKDSKK